MMSTTCLALIVVASMLATTLGFAVAAIFAVGSHSDNKPPRGDGHGPSQDLPRHRNVRRQPSNSDYCGGGRTAARTYQMPAKISTTTMTIAIACSAVVSSMMFPPGLGISGSI